VIRHRFQHKYYKNLDVFQPNVDNLVQIIRKSGDVVDLQPLFSQMTLDISTEYLFGESVRSLVAQDGSEMRRFADAFDVVSGQATAQMRLYDLRWITGRRRCQRAQKDLNRITDQILERNLGAALEGYTETSRHEFLCALARDSPDRTVLRGQVLNLLAAGRDTTASLLSWTL
jgi:cytochrome P450